MNCRGVINELKDFLDGESNAALVAEVEQHLAHCVDCQLIVDTTRKTIEVFCNSRPAELPDDVRSRLHAALRTRLQKRA